MIAHISFQLMLLSMSPLNGSILNMKTYQLVVVELWSAFVLSKPPGGSTDSGGSDVSTNSHVTEEQPVADEGLFAATWWLVHDLEIWWVEAESGGWKTVSDKVDPEQLNWDESLRHTHGSSQEDTHDLDKYKITKLETSLISLLSSFKKNI